MRVCVGLAILATTSFLLGSCASAPTPEQVAAADYGRPISQSEAKAAVEGYLRRTLKDPLSMIVEYVKGPERRWQSFFGPAQFGYAVCAFVNAKNSFGGYVGARPYLFMIKDGVVIQVVYGDGQQYDFGGAAAQKACTEMQVAWRE